nr:cytochrome d ubiquinol oxidase subunit II [Arachnia sp.]
HGSAFIALKTKGHIHDRAEAFGAKFGWAATALVALFVICQNVFWPASSEFGEFTAFAWIAGVLAIASIGLATVMIGKGRDGWGFVLTGLSVVTLFVGIFLRMYGNLGFAQDTSVPATERLNIITAASSQTTLTIMTWAAVIFVPIVLAYQAWSYWVFHKRISTKNIPDDVEAVA